MKELDKESQSLPPGKSPSSRCKQRSLSCSGLSPKASNAGVHASISVVDPSMNLIAFAKADGATPHSVDSSRRKANTAASTRRATGWMGADLALPLPMATDLKLTNIIGGAPLAFDGAVSGAIGVAGGTPDQDAQIAMAAAAYAAEL